MGSIFSYDSPFMNTMRKALSLVWLNILTMVFSIPLVTIGAALCAAYDCAAKIRTEEGSVTTNFWNAFRSSFKDGTICWLLFLVVAAVLISGYQICVRIDLVAASVSQVLLVVEGILAVILLIWVFPLVATFQNKIWLTVKNALTLTIAFLPTTLLMLVLYVLPLILYLLVPPAFVLLPLFGISCPIYWNGPLYQKVFRKVADLQEAD